MSISWDFSSSSNECEEQELEYDTSKNRKFRKTLSIFHLFILSFFLISASPFGFPEIIYSGGAFLSFISMLIIPVSYSLPLALISSEQASRHPICGGVVIYGVTLGKFMSWVFCYLKMIESIINHSFFSQMLFKNLSMTFPRFSNIISRIIIAILSNGFVIYCNWMGLQAVGWVSFIVSLFILMPFVMFFLFAAKYITLSRVFAPYPE